MVSVCGSQKNSGTKSVPVDIKNTVLPFIVVVCGDVSIPFGSVNVSPTPSPSVSFE